MGTHEGRRFVLVGMGRNGLAAAQGALGAHRVRRGEAAAQAVTSYWLEECVACRMLLEPSAHLLFEPRPHVAIGIFSTYHISATQYKVVDGIKGQERRLGVELIKIMGAKYSDAFEPKSCSHLICPAIFGAKCEKAAKHKVPMVTFEWLYECYRRGCEVSLDSYRPKRDVAAAAATRDAAAAAAAEALSGTQVPATAPQPPSQLPPRASAPPDAAGLATAAAAAPAAAAPTAAAPAAAKRRPPATSAGGRASDAPLERQPSEGQPSPDPPLSSSQRREPVSSPLPKSPMLDGMRRAQHALLPSAPHAYGVAGAAAADGDGSCARRPQPQGEGGARGAPAAARPASAVAVPAEPPHRSGVAARPSGAPNSALQRCGTVASAEMILQGLETGGGLDDCTMAPMPAAGRGALALARDDGLVPRRPVRRAELDGTDGESWEASQVSEVRYEDPQQREQQARIRSRMLSSPADDEGGAADELDADGAACSIHQLEEMRRKLRAQARPPNGGGGRRRRRAATGNGRWGRRRRRAAGRAGRRHLRGALEQPLAWRRRQATAERQDARRRGGGAARSCARDEARRAGRADGCAVRGRANVLSDPARVLGRHRRAGRAVGPLGRTAVRPRRWAAADAAVVRGRGGGGHAAARRATGGPLVARRGAVDGSGAAAARRATAAGEARFRGRARTPRCICVRRRRGADRTSGGWRANGGRGGGWGSDRDAQALHPTLQPRLRPPPRRPVAGGRLATVGRRDVGGRGRGAKPRHLRHGRRERRRTAWGVHARPALAAHLPARRTARRRGGTRR